jgi:hypothetical protein
MDSIGGPQKSRQEKIDAPARVAVSGLIDIRMIELISKGWMP